jgi:hypothetical protein
MFSPRRRKGRKERWGIKERGRRAPAVGEPLLRVSRDVAGIGSRQVAAAEELLRLERSESADKAVDYELLGGVRQARSPQGIDVLLGSEGLPL